MASETGAAVERRKERDKKERGRERRKGEGETDREGGKEREKGWEVGRALLKGNTVNMYR